MIQSDGDEMDLLELVIRRCRKKKKRSDTLWLRHTNIERGTSESSLGMCPSGLLASTLRQEIYWRLWRITLRELGGLWDHTWGIHWLAVSIRRKLGLMTVWRRIDGMGHWMRHWKLQIAIFRL